MKSKGKYRIHKSLSLVGKSAILEQTFKHIVENIPEDSYVMVGRFGSGSEWLTPKPELCTNSKKFAIQELLNKPAEKTDLNLEKLLDSVYKIPQSDCDYPRSVIIISNGNFKHQKRIEEQVADLSMKDIKLSVRVSCLGIGSGSSDSFLRNIANKGHGLVQVVTSSDQIKERVEFFIKHLRAKCISNINITYDPEAIMLTLPMYKPHHRLLKSTPFELYFYAQPNHPKKKTAITLSYFDEEDKTNKKITIKADLTQYGAENKSDLHKIIINKLLSEKYIIQNSEYESKLRQVMGEDNWSLRLAIDHQIFTPETAYLAIAHDLPEGFDQLEGDLETLENVKQLNDSNSIVSGCLNAC